VTNVVTLPLEHTIVNNHVSRTLVHYLLNIL